MKKQLACILAALLLVMLLPLGNGAVLAEEANIEMQGNAFKVTTSEDFIACELENVEITSAAGDGAVQLMQGATDGMLISPIYGVDPFEYLVVSWNADTPAGTWVELEASVYLDMQGEWSPWLSWGKWGTGMERASTNGQNVGVRIDTDIFTVLGSAGETASMIMLRAALHSETEGVTPVLRQIAATYKNTLVDEGITPNYLEERVELPERVMLSTPAYSQMTREGSIANVMCSAVTICTMLNDRGEDLLPEEVALLNYDYVYDGFGNWPFSVAAAGAYGYESYVQYADFDILRQELARGYSVGISVKYSSSAGGNYPYLENGAISSTSGHLITLTGYETVDGIDYFFSSDSAATGDANCVRRYRADQLDEAWAGRVAYIVHDKEAGAGHAATSRVEAELRYVDGSENEYALYVDGARMDLLPTFLNKKFKDTSGGVIAYTIEGQPMEDVPAPAKLTTANSKMFYSIAVTNGGNLRIDPSRVLGSVSADSGTINVYIMCGEGTTYVSALNITRAPAVPAPTEEPAPAPTETPAELADTTPQTSTPDITVIVIIAVAVLAIACIVFVMLRKRNK